MSQPQLGADPNWERGEIQRLTERVQELEDSVSQAAELLRARDIEYDRAMRVLGRIRTLVTQDVAAMPVPDSAAGDAAPQNSRWSAIAARLGGRKGQFINALAELGPLTGPQLKAATKSGNTTVRDTCWALSKSGLIVKDGKTYRLKEG